MVTNSGSKFNGKQEGVIVNVELKCQTRLQLVNSYTTSKSKLPPTSTPCRMDGVRTGNTFFIEFLS
jgi:hypothetical protein